jgi:plasmid maintenance system killer protein
MKPRPVRNIFPSSRYATAFKKLDPQLQQRLIEREKLFMVNAYHPGLKTHRLEGGLGEKDFYAYYVNDSLRVMFQFISSDGVLYVDVNDHRIYRA